MAAPSNRNETFRGAEPTWANACVGNNGSPGYWEYADGFSYAANLLLNQILDNKDRNNVDIVIYPICFNIRHAVELRLKHAIIRIRELYEIKKIDKQFNLLNIHDIKNLWNIIVESTKELDKRFSIVVEKIEEYISDISQIDPTGQTFRYPYSNEEVKHLTEESIINLFVIRSRFKKLSQYLSIFVEYIKEISIEYSQGLFTEKLSREDLFKISREIPPYSEWGDHEFLAKKVEIIERHSLSRRNFSEALNKIKEHTELSYFIHNKQDSVSFSKEKIKTFFHHWSQINPQPKISLEEQQEMAQKRAKEMLESIGTEREKKQDFNIEELFNEERLFEEYWNSHGKNLSPEDIAYIISFYENTDFTYSEYFQRTLARNKEFTLKATEENKERVSSLFTKSLLFEKTVHNLLLLKEFDLVENLITSLDLPIDNYPIQHYKDHINMPDIFGNCKRRLHSVN